MACRDGHDGGFIQEIFTGMRCKFIDKIARFVERKELFRDGGRYIVTLSGGSDSVALLLVMLRLGRNLKIDAAHCNFHLRGEESDRDERFCADLCQRLGVELHRAHFDTRTYASSRHQSIEMAARELRYNYFGQLCASLDADGICVAHHQDDSVETFLINLLRGAGIDGLCGIRARNQRILRPLLCVGRQDILDFLASAEQPFVTDSTNLVPDVVRNKIRLRLLPLLEEIAPAARRQILLAAERIDEARTVVDSALKTERDEVCHDGRIDMDMLKRQPSPPLLLHRLLSPYGFNAAQESEILASDAACQSRRWLSPTHEAWLIGHELVTEEIDNQANIEMRLSIEGVYDLPDGRRLRLRSMPRESLDAIPHEPWRAALDADKAGFPLLLRNPVRGDTFRPYGMMGRRKPLGRFLTDAKLSPRERRHTLLLLAADGEIAWVLGHRVSHSAAVSGHTRRVLLAEIMGQ